MVVSNLGTIVLSLPPGSPGGNTTANVSSQVRLLSFFNTISRLIVGPLADALAPVASRFNGVWTFSRKRYTSRVVFMFGTSLLLALTFGWLELGVRTQESVWPLSVGTGIAYGSTFTILYVHVILFPSVDELADIVALHVLDPEFCRRSGASTTLGGTLGTSPTPPSSAPPCSRTYMRLSPPAM